MKEVSFSDDKKVLVEKFLELKELVETSEVNMQEFVNKDNLAAAGRVKKLLRDSKKKVADLRKLSLDLTKKMKEERKK